MLLTPKGTLTQTMGKTKTWAQILDVSWSRSLNLSKEREKMSAGFLRINVETEQTKAAKEKVTFGFVGDVSECQAAFFFLRGSEVISPWGRPPCLSVFCWRAEECECAALHTPQKWRRNFPPEAFILSVFTVSTISFLCWLLQIDFGCRRDARSSLCVSIRAKST